MAETEQQTALSRYRHRCDVEIAPLGGLTATLEATVHPGAPEVPPSDIVAANQDVFVNVRWCVQGELRHHLCGTWCVKAAYESCGDGPEGHQVVHVPFNPCLDDDTCYEAVVPIRASEHKLLAGECGTVYCFCVTLSSEYDCDGKRFPGPIWGFCNNIACIMVRDVAA
jgi:hypothetical protein